MTALVSAEVRDLLALHLVPGLGPRLTAALLERFGSASRVRSASAAELKQVPYIGETLSAKLAASLETIDVEVELTKMARHKVSLLALGLSRLSGGAGDHCQSAAPHLLPGQLGSARRQSGRHCGLTRLHGLRQAPR
jgi:hypothetical protein